MFFFFCRLIGIWCLAATIVAAVVDGMKSIAAGRVVTTPLLQLWTSASPSSLASAQAAVQKLSPALWDPVGLTILHLPAWIVFTVIGAAFIFLGTRRRRTVVYVT